MRNFLLARVFGAHVRVRAGVVAAALALAMVLGASALAEAHVRVFVGGTVGVPVWGSPYLYASPYPYYYGPYPGPYAAPPPGWAPGRWEWQYNPDGWRYRVWVPPHLQ